MTPKNKPSYSFANFFYFLKSVLAREKNLYWLIIIYGIGISILSLSIPIAVQYIIGNITFTALLGPLVVIVIILIITLVFYALLKVMQLYATHIFSKHFFARIVGDIFNSFVYSDYEDFDRCNRTDIANRFFEIINIQKVFPVILFEGFSIIQQIIVGFILISFYHVSFLAFSIFIAFLTYLIIRVKGLKSLNNLYATSNSKYAVIDLLENISRMHREFKSGNAIAYSKRKVNTEVAEFLHNFDSYFSVLLSQSISFLSLYILSSCGFLLIGSVLVFEGDITVGQLVAMELIVSTILIRLSEFSKYLDSFYELSVSCKKIGTFYDINSEQILGTVNAADVPETASIITLNSVAVLHQNQSFAFKFSIAKNSINLMAFDNDTTRQMIYKLLLKFIKPITGVLTYYDVDTELINQHSLRDKIYMVDSTDMYNSTIEAYLTDGLDIAKTDIQAVLTHVQLDTKTEKLDITQAITPCGYPLSATQIIRLKIAKALLYKPDLLILGTVFDRIEYYKKQLILQAIRDKYPGLTLIHFTHFTNMTSAFEYNQYFFVSAFETHQFDKQDDFIAYQHS